MKKMIKLFVALLCFGFSMVVLAVNVNTASAEDIAKELKGVGPATATATASAIVVYREEHGAFKSLKDLTNVKRIGAATVDKNRENIQLETKS